MGSSHSLHFVRSVINLVERSCFSEIFEQDGDWRRYLGRDPNLEIKLRTDRIVRLSWFDGKSQKTGHHMLAESARIRQKYTCCATGATKVSFHHDSRESLSKSAGPNKRLYHLRYPRLLISPRNPNIFFLTICTLPSSCGVPRYPENKQVVRVYFANPTHSSQRVFISSRCVREILIESIRA